MRNRKKVILAGVSIVITALLILSWGIFQKTSGMTRTEQESQREETEDPAFPIPETKKETDLLGLIETEERSEAYESEEEMTDETEIQEIQAEPLTEQAAGDFLIQGVTEEIQSSFLKVEMDFRYLVEYRAENIHTAPLDTVTFLEELYKTEKEISWRIQLLFFDGQTHEMAATYHFTPGYSRLEELEDYTDRREEESEVEAYLSTLHPEVTEEAAFQKSGNHFRGDKDQLIRKLGEFLYRYFGEIEVAKIQIEYLLSEDEQELSYRITLVEGNGDATPLCCRYFPAADLYSFKLVEEY